MNKLELEVGSQTKRSFAGGVCRLAAVPGLLADVILQSAGGRQPQPQSWPMALQNRMYETP